MLKHRFLHPIILISNKTCLRICKLTGNAVLLGRGKHLHTSGLERLIETLVNKIDWIIMEADEFAVTYRFCLVKNCRQLMATKKGIINLVQA